MEISSLMTQLGPFFFCLGAKKKKSQSPAKKRKKTTFQTCLRESVPCKETFPPKHMICSSVHARSGAHTHTHTGECAFCPGGITTYNTSAGHNCMHTVLLTGSLSFNPIKGTTPSLISDA